MVPIKDGNIPKTNVVFINAFLDLKRNLDIQYAVKIVRIVPKIQLIEAINNVFKNHFL